MGYGPLVLGAGVGRGAGFGDVYGRNVRDTSFWNPEKQISEDIASSHSPSTYRVLKLKARPQSRYDFQHQTTSLLCSLSQYSSF